MDVTFLLEALKLGISNMATQAVKDAYDRLKMLLSDRFIHNPSAKDILQEYEQDHENKKLEKLLKSALEDANVVRDDAIQLAAQELMRVTSPQAVLASPGATSIQTHGNHTQNGTRSTQTLIGKEQTNINGNENQVFKAEQHARDNTFVGSVGRDFINHKIPLPMWALLLFLLISAGLGFRGGAVTENQRLGSKLEEAQKRADQTDRENSKLQKTIEEQKNSGSQALEDLKRKLQATEKDLNQTQIKLKNAEAELVKIRDEATKSLNGTWDLQKADYICITKRSQGFSGVDSINCSRLSDQLKSTELVINQTGNSFTIDSASSFNVKSGSIGRDGTFVAKGVDHDNVETVLNGKMTNNDEITGTLSIYSRGFKAYSTEFFMKRKTT